jgi:hypothetical protein
MLYFYSSIDLSEPKCIENKAKENIMTPLHNIPTSIRSGVSALLVVLLALAMLTFTRSVHAAAIQPDLKTASSFAALASATVSNAGLSTVEGDVGTQSNAPTSVTGFPPGTLTGTIHRGDATAVQAHQDAANAYADAAGQGCTNSLTGQDLGGQTLTTGVYCFSSSASLTGELTLSGPGVFIFQTVSSLITANGSPTSHSSVVLTNGALACNVFWQVGSSATLGEYTNFAGNILAHTSITGQQGASSNGSLYAIVAAVTLATNSVQTCQ